MARDPKNQLYALIGKNLGKQQVIGQKGRKLITTDGSFIDFASTNYLGFDFHPKMQSAGLAMHEKWGALSGWSRLEIDADLYPRVEKSISQMLGCRDSILAHTITVTNFSVIPAIVKKGAIFCDQKLHTVVWEACRLARDHGASLEKFPHQDLVALETQLKNCRTTGPKLICVDGVYSISGAQAPIKELQTLCRQYGAWLLVDDAHGFGILGRASQGQTNPYGFGGTGVVNHHGGDYNRTFYVSSFGKSFCTHSAFITLPTEFEGSLREECTQYIYSAPMPPFVVGMVEEALRLNDSEGEVARERIFQLTKRFVDGLRTMNLKVQNHEYFPIVFWEVGSLEDLMATSEILFNKGVVAGLRAYPVVPHDACGLRFGITALHTFEQIDESLAKIEATIAQVRSLKRAA